MEALRALENTSILFGVLPADYEGIDDLKESFNLGGFPALDVGRPKVSKNQVSSESFIKRVDPALDDFYYGSLRPGAPNSNAKSAAGHTTKPAAIISSIDSICHLSGNLPY